MIPYGRQYIDEADIKAVVEVLQSNWLTTGPKVDEFEEAIAEYVNVKHSVAVSSGTAALHSAMYAIGIGHGDEVIVPSMTFAATANCVVFQGGIPVFADVDKDTLLINPEDVQRKITDRTKAIIAVDYAGQPCDYDRLKPIAEENGLKIIADSCHALGAEYKVQKSEVRGQKSEENNLQQTPQWIKVGNCEHSDITIFSFHPVKHITTGEGGMITTDDEELAKRIRLFRNHGIDTDFHQREQKGSWYYEISDIGYNYRITDFQCALGLSQLRKLPHFLERRREIASYYNEAIENIEYVNPLTTRRNVFHAYHLYVVRCDFKVLKIERAYIFKKLREKGIGVNVHYIPVHLHPVYQKRFGTTRGLCPIAEAAYEEILSFPMHPSIDKDTVKEIVAAITKVLGEN